MNLMGNPTTDFSSMSKNTLVVTVLILLLGMIALAQVPAAYQIPAAQKMAIPFVDKLQGVSMGMTVGEVIDRLGKPKFADKLGMFFALNKNDSAQVRFGAKGRVRTITLRFRNGSLNAPDIKDIFGPSIEQIENADGSIHKLIRYDSEGFWLAYSRNGDKQPVTTVTMRRIDL